MSARELAIAVGILLASSFAPGAVARAQTPERESVSREAAGDDKKAGPGKSPIKAAHDAHAHGDPSKHFRFFGSPFGHGDKDVAGGPHGDGVNKDLKTGHAVPGEEEPMSAPFIFMILNFVVLLALLSKYGRPAARKLAAERHDQIKTALDEAAKLRKQAADKLAEYESRLKAADAEIETARAALTREVTAAAAAATEKLLRERMTAADQQKLVGTFISDLQAVKREEAR